MKRDKRKEELPKEKEKRTECLSLTGFLNNSKGFKNILTSSLLADQINQPNTVINGSLFFFGVFFLSNNDSVRLIHSGINTLAAPLGGIKRKEESAELRSPLFPSVTFC